MAPNPALQGIAPTRRALLGAAAGMLLAARGLVLPEWLREAEARKGANGGELGGRHGKNRRSRDRHRSHGEKKDRNKKKAKNGGSLGSGSGYRDCSQVRIEPGVDLSRCDLHGADLSDANLSGANLSTSDLRFANLSGALLNIANLTGADLSDANLSGANLIGADLFQANLARANLTGALFCGTRMPDGTERNDNIPQCF